MPVKLLEQFVSLIRILSKETEAQHMMIWTKTVSFMPLKRKVSLASAFLESKISSEKKSQAQ